VVSPGGRPTLLARFGYFASAADMPPLPEPGADEIIVVAPDGSCLGRERGDCPPNKICAAPEIRPVRCPK
jgi:hypothetical protein